MESTAPFQLEVCLLLSPIFPSPNFPHYHTCSFVIQDLINTVSIFETFSALHLFLVYVLVISYFFLYVQSFEVYHLITFKNVSYKRKRIQLTHLVSASSKTQTYCSRFDALESKEIQLSILCIIKKI